MSDVQWIEAIIGKRCWGSPKQNIVSVIMIAIVIVIVVVIVVLIVVFVPIPFIF